MKYNSESMPFVAHDLFVKHMAISDVIDIGIEILPMKDLKGKCRLECPTMTRDGSNIPAVPLVIIGIAP